MTESHLHRLEQAWRDAPEAAVARALSTPDDYDAEALPIIQREAARRGIDAAAMVRDAPPDARDREPSPASRLLGWAGSYLRRHRLVAAGLWGGALPLMWMLIERGVAPETTASRVVCLLAVLLVFLAGLTAVAWPLLRYRAAVLVTLVAVAAAASVGFVRILLATPEFRRSWVQYILWPSVASFMLTWTLSCLVICAAVWVRRRSWPVYPAGCCVRCGYDLRGQVEPRCPECGTAFDRTTAENGAAKVSAVEAVNTDAPC